MNSIPTSQCRLLKNTWYLQIFLVSMQHRKGVTVKHKVLQGSTTAHDSLLPIVCVNWNTSTEGDGFQLIHARQTCTVPLWCIDPLCFSLPNWQLCTFPNWQEEAEKLFSGDPVLLCGCFSDFHFTHGWNRKVKQVASYLLQKKEDFLVLLQDSYNANYNYLKVKIVLFRRSKSFFSFTED